MVTFLCVSDTHNHSLKEIIGDMTADVLLHAGDWTMRGTLPEARKSMEYLYDIRPQFKRVIGIPGNHDFHFTDYPYLIREFKKELDVDILLDRVENVMGIRVFGSPWVPQFGDWAYMYPRPTTRWLHRPQSDIVMTHGPMYGILDLTPRGEKVGCWDLKDSIYRMNPKPKVFVCGHIHHSAGSQEVDGVLCINAATCNEHYSPDNLPQVFEL